MALVIHRAIRNNRLRVKMFCNTLSKGGVIRLTEGF
jgi:hypothetical protein